MIYSNSQEQTIYRSLAGQIQLGFFNNGERFPSVQEIADRYQVSYCPAQRALKILEKNGLIKLSRSKETVVLSKPYKNYLKSDVFRVRIEALADLCKSLELISSSICIQGICNMKPSSVHMTKEEIRNNPGKYLYRLFDQSLRALGSQTILSLYYDVGAFVESAFLDILYTLYTTEETNQFLNTLSNSFLESLQDCQNNNYALAKQKLDYLSMRLYGDLAQYFESIPHNSEYSYSEPFYWEPHKGRTRYCDVIAIDLICKIHQGTYSVNTFLPKGEVLAEIYHVSPITIRRTIILLNKLDIVKTINGVGTKIIFAGDSAILYKFKDLMMDDNLKFFLEAFQMLAIICEPILAYTFPHLSAESSDAIAQAVDTSMVATISACMQAVVHCCPLISIQNIFQQITLLLLKGSVLRLETGEEPVSDWPELSNILQKSFQEENGTLFAKTFRRLIESNFFRAKHNLLKIGIMGAEQLMTPKSFL